MTLIQYLPTPFSYSSAVAAGEFIFLGLHRGFGDTFGQQLAGALDGIAASLGHFGLPLARLIQVRVWLKHIQDLPEMEAYFARRFEAGQSPARMTATTEFIDADCLVMIEGTAYRGGL